LGEWVHDPFGVEGDAGSTAGLGLLRCETQMEREKALVNRAGTIEGLAHADRHLQATVKGYEIHMGVTSGPDCAHPLIHYEEAGCDGAVSEDGLVAGTYWHGVFDEAEATQAVLAWANMEDASGLDLAEVRSQQLDRLADALECNLDMPKLMAETRRFYEANVDG